MSGFKNRTRGRGGWRGDGRGRGKDTENVTEDRPPKDSYNATERSVKTSRHSLTQGSSDLCELYVSGPCYCSRLHHSKRSPYVWQYQIKPDLWSLLSNVQMELLEQAFCNNEERTVVEIKRLGDVKETTVTFDEILDPPSRSSVNKFSFQRLSTRSYAEAGSDHITLYTKWVWYWKDNNTKWSPFVPPELQLTLETKYLAGQDTYLYTIADQEYRLDFTSLVQANRKYQTRRPVQRRPMFVSLDDARSRQQTCLLMSPATVTPTDVPSHWAPLDRYQNSEKVELDASSAEFTTVMSSIYKTLSANRCQVQRVYRLQNALLWHNFHSMKKTLQMSLSTESIDQRQLFHGTDTLDVVNNICINNFDFRVSGKNATVYGKGAYFARDAKFSHSYTKGRDRYMFLARVLVGKYTLGDSSYTRPPPRKGHVLYDSCVNDINNPSIFVIFERNQCYPEYLVEYRDETVDESVSVNKRNGTRRTAVASVTSALKHTSPVQPVPAAPSLTKSPSVKSTGNSFLNQNQTIPATNTGVASAFKHSSPVQPVPAAPSLTKTPSVKSTGNSSLHQNQTIPATSTVSASSSSSNQHQVNPGQSSTSASPIQTPPSKRRSSFGNGTVLKLGRRGHGQGNDDQHSPPVQPVPAALSPTKTPSVKSTGNSSLNQNQTIPATSTGVASAFKHSSPVQPVPAAPSLTKTPSVKSTGNSSLHQNQTIPATSTVSTSSSSSNQHQVNPGQSSTSASPIQTPPSKRRSSFGNGTVLKLGRRGHGQGNDDQHSPPVQPVPAALSPTKTPSVKSTGNSSLNQNQTIPATSTGVASAFKHSSPVQPVPAAPSLTKTLSVKSTGNSSLHQNQTIPATSTVSASSSTSNQRQVNRTPVHDQSALSQKTSTTEGSGLNNHNQDKSSDSTLTTSTLRQALLSQKTSPSARLNTSNNHNEIDASPACCQNKQSQIYYKVSSTRTTAIYVRADDDGTTANSATYPRVLPTGGNLKPVPFSPERKKKDCTIL